MATHLLDYLEPTVCPVVADRGPTPIEIQRWEDDGGAVIPDARPRQQRSLHGTGHDFTVPRSLAA